MLAFRPRADQPASGQAPLDLLAVGQLIDELMQPGQFFVAPELSVTWVMARAEEIPWEVFRGRLLDPAHTRQRRSFLSWHLYQTDAETLAAEPLLSVKLDVSAREIHVVRGILCHVWEGFEQGSEIQSREVMRWTRELVGTIPLTQFPDADELKDELICQLWQAVIGTSRLPLHSVEAPLPAFTLGQLHHAYQETSPVDEPRRSPFELLHAGLSWREQAKVLELLLRRLPPHDMDQAAADFVTRWRRLGQSERDLPRLLRTLFNEVSLSPYTHFVDRALAFVAALTEQNILSLEERIDFLGYLLRQVGRHLTAYDLVTFHHRGANYPDALLLDAVLRQYLNLIETHPELFRAARLRRRALRQGCLLRRHYEGHGVPDAPTSPGENARVLPAPHERVPEEQLLQPHRRRRRLFVDAPLTGLLGPQGRDLLQQSLVDLEAPEEQAELGLALFIDRPLGYAKAAAEPDLTPLLTHVAYSPSVARRRLTELRNLANELGLVEPTLRELAAVAGLPHQQLAEPARPTASLADMRKVAEDFVIVRTLPGGLAELLQGFDLSTYLPVSPRLVVRIARGDGPVLTFFDETYRPLLELAVDASQGFIRRAGLEFPVAGLRILDESPQGTRLLPRLT